MGSPVNIDALINECLDAGIIWWPRDGRLRPQFTRGRPPEALLTKVRTNKDALYRALKELTDRTDETEDDNENDSK